MTQQVWKGRSISMINLIVVLLLPQSKRLIAKGAVCSNEIMIYIYRYLILLTENVMGNLYIAVIKHHLIL